MVCFKCGGYVISFTDGGLYCKFRHQRVRPCVLCPDLVQGRHRVGAITKTDREYSKKLKHEKY
jgi:hypothetical protein